MEKDNPFKYIGQCLKAVYLFLCLKYLPALVTALFKHAPAMFVLIAVLAVIKPAMVLIGKNVDASIKQQEIEQRREEAQDRLEAQQEAEDRARKDAIVREWKRTHPKDNTVFTWEDLQAKRLSILQQEEEWRQEEKRRKQQAEQRAVERKRQRELRRKQRAIENCPLPDEVPVRTKPYPGDENVRIGPPPSAFAVALDEVEADTQVYTEDIRTCVHDSDGTIVSAYGGTPVFLIPGKRVDLPANTSFVARSTSNGWRLSFKSYGTYTARKIK